MIPRMVTVDQISEAVMLKTPMEASERLLKIPGVTEVRMTKPGPTEYEITVNCEDGEKVVQKVVRIGAPIEVGA